MSHLMFIGELEPEPSVIYKKPTNSVGGWSYAVEPEAEDSKFYEFGGEWFYVVKDKVELISLRDQGTWLTSTDPNQLVSITDKDSITKSIPMNNLVITRIGNMDDMFYNHTSFNQYIGNWDVSNVTDVYRMFRNTSFNQDIGNWDTGNVGIMRDMFYQSSFNQDIGNWDVSNVWSMRSVFGYSSFNQDIGNWDTGNVMDMYWMFRNTPFNQDIGNWDVSNVGIMSNMFNSNSSFNQDLSSWCVSGVTDHTNFDVGTTAWTLPKPNFDNPPC